MILHSHTNMYKQPLSLMLMPMHIHIPYRNLMIKICLTDFGRKGISRIVGDLEMPVDASVVGINPAVMTFTEQVDIPSNAGCTDTAMMLRKPQLYRAIPFYPLHHRLFKITPGFCYPLKTLSPCCRPRQIFV